MNGYSVFSSDFHAIFATLFQPSYFIGMLFKLVILFDCKQKNTLNDILNHHLQILTICTNQSSTVTNEIVIILQEQIRKHFITLLLVYHSASDTISLNS